MSPSAIFVFLLVSAVHMLECILDLKRRVGANCQENPALSFLSLSLVPDNSFGEKCFDFGWIDVRGSISDDQLRLRVEITQLLKEASALSTPSTFAQAAKLKRLAGAKEKELAKSKR
ncbi:hypothetical protein Zm00014a_028175 [Zea mays]|uniref:Uncharacterized protein n=1 Tax=Zea mays TaxID=4577 RepID=A0A3L6DGQ3_MAIZE|nr:hypothetical protein Zm00014a_028175 [Zea mays]